MSTHSAGMPASPWLRSKYLVFGFVTLMLVYVLNHNERFLVDFNDPAWNHYQPFKWWLLFHGLGGACAIFLGPFQFSDRLRRKYLQLHRVLGRIYVGGVLFVAPLGALIQYRFDEKMFGAPRSFTIAAGVDALLLMATTLIALSFVLRGKIQQHRQWMTRSYAVAVVFLEVRVISGLGGWDQDIAMTETIVWTCLAFSLLVADVIIQWQDFRSNRAIAQKQTAATAAR